MTSLKTFRVTVWDHSFIAATVRARSEHDALCKVEAKYAAARPAECKGFELLDNHADDWDVRPFRSSSRRRRSP